MAQELQPDGIAGPKAPHDYTQEGHGREQDACNDPIPFPLPFIEAVPPDHILREIAGGDPGIEAAYGKPHPAEGAALFQAGGQGGASAGGAGYRKVFPSPVVHDHCMECYGALPTEFLFPLRVHGIFPDPLCLAEGPAGMKGLRRILRSHGYGSPHGIVCENILLMQADPLPGQSLFSGLQAKAQILGDHIRFFPLAGLHQIPVRKENVLIFRAHRHLPKVGLTYPVTVPVLRQCKRLPLSAPIRNYSDTEASTSGVISSLYSG